MSDAPELSPHEMKLQTDGAGIDWFLQKIVSMVNLGSLEIGITLYMQGSIISGQLVSGPKYFKTIAQQFSDSYPGSVDSKATMREAIESNGDVYKQENDEESPLPHFIHLLDARCFAHGQNPIPSNGGVAWRGRINAVSGFTLGQLGKGLDEESE